MDDALERVELGGLGSPWPATRPCFKATEGLDCVDNFSRG